MAGKLKGSMDLGKGQNILYFYFFTSGYNKHTFKQYGLTKVSRRLHYGYTLTRTEPPASGAPFSRILRILPHFAPTLVLPYLVGVLASVPTSGLP